MFTGLIQDVGAVARVEHRGANLVLTVRTALDLKQTAAGDSICIDGYCQTVARIEGDSFTVEPKEKKTPKVDLMAILVRDWMNRAIIRAKFLKELKDTLEREFSKKIKPKRFTGGLVQFISTHPSTDHCITPSKFDKFLKKAFETKRRRK